MGRDLYIIMRIQMQQKVLVDRAKLFAGRSPTGGEQDDKAWHS